MKMEARKQVTIIELVEKLIIALLSFIHYQ